jgi:inorganic triphosphatase YgiF
MADSRRIYCASSYYFDSNLGLDVLTTETTGAPIVTQQSPERPNRQMSFMASKPSQHPFQEIELKLALPTTDPAGLLRRLARVPVLARRSSSQQRLHTVYYDTPDQTLLRERIALRLRRVGGPAKPRWLQTLKTAGSGGSALSQRGEWETRVPGPALSRQALQATPWRELDPDGSLFAALAPCFATDFERTTWLVRRRDRSEVEVALDLGQIVAGAHTTPIVELELELKAGTPLALLDVAAQIAAFVAVLPLAQSKAQRGYALAQGTLHQPLRAQPPVLHAKLSVPDAAQRVLSEMLGQFCTNLHALLASDDPELVHQARVGWRRFRSAWRLFRPALAAHPAPSWEALQPLWEFVGKLRDLDVARTETLPPLAPTYVAADAQRAQQWQELEQALAQAATVQRKAVRYALQEPSIGAALLDATRWLEGLTGHDATAQASLRSWAQGRVRRLHKRLQAAVSSGGEPEAQHRARIEAKRLRYSIEALRALLPKRRTQDWYEQASNLQTRIGTARDLQQASALAQQLGAAAELVAFVRGVAVGRTQRK